MLILNTDSRTSVKCRYMEFSGKFYLMHEPELHTHGGHVGMLHSVCAGKKLAHRVVLQQTFCSFKGTYVCFIFISYYFHYFLV